MSMTTASANGSFLPSETGDLIVRPVEKASIALQVSKVAFTDPTVHEYRVPVVANDPTAEWTEEGEEINDSVATLAEESSKFFKLAGLTVVSNELANDSDPAAASIVGEGLARDIARKLDAAFFGTKGGSDIQPTGLADLTGVNTVSAGPAWANLDPFLEAIYDAESEGAGLRAFVAHPDDALALAQLKEAETSKRSLLQSDPTEPTRRQIAGVPLFVSPAVAKTTVWGIPSERIIVALRDDVRLDVNESAYFTSDKLAIRATMRVAFLFPHKSAIQKIQLVSGS